MWEKQKDGRMGESEISESRDKHYVLIEVEETFVGQIIKGGDEVT